MERKNRIKILAAERDLTVAALARLVGVHAATLRTYTRQHRQPPLKKAKKIADALGISVDDVIGTYQSTGAEADNDHLALAASINNLATAINNLTTAIRLKDG